jgi:hypothetical protein
MRCVLSVVHLIVGGWHSEVGPVPVLRVDLASERGIVIPCDNGCI